MYAKRRQQGVVLLTLMLVIMAAGSFVLLKALNVAASNSGYDESATRSALMQAKLALIGYSVNDPAANLGPGRLPCPDFSGDGAAVGSCSLGGANPTTGRFPYATIGNGRITDSTGADLWYAVADSHRYFLTTPINSDTGDTTDDLSVDGEDDILAVIIAPGPPLAGQSRSTSAGLADFLEGDNASLGDSTFTRTSESPFNDKIITLTRGELMAAVEQRVLGEVNRHLAEYFAAYGGYPWASAIADPATKTLFDETISLRDGHLAVHQNGDVFPSAFSLDWNVPSDGTLSVGPEPNEICIRWNECTDPDPDIDFDFTGNTITFTSGLCTWIDAETFNCQGTEAVSATVAGGAALIRTFTVNLTITGMTPTVTAPTALAPRIRGAVFSGRLPPGSSGTIGVSDLLSGVPRGVSRTLTLSAGDSVTVSFQNVRFLLGDDRDVVVTEASSPAALPRWFTANQWHHYIHYAYALPESLGGSGTCVAGSSCLTLEVARNGTTTANDRVRGLVVIAGRQLTGLPRGGLMSDYFELENDQATTPNEVFSMRPVSGTFSDRVSVLATVP